MWAQQTLSLYLGKWSRVVRRVLFVATKTGERANDDETYEWRPKLGDGRPNRRVRAIPQGSLRLPPPYPCWPWQGGCLPPHQPRPRRLHGRRHLPCRIRRRPIFLLQRRYLPQAFSVPRCPPLSLRLPCFSSTAMIDSTPNSPNSIFHFSRNQVLLEIQIGTMEPQGAVESIKKEK